MQTESAWDDLPLGRVSALVDVYTPSLLRRIARADARINLGWSGALPFTGHDSWTAYELTWLNPKGRPECAVLSLEIPSASPCFVESKSLKLYLNSFRQTVFASWLAVEETVSTDLTHMCASRVTVSLMLPRKFATRTWRAAQHSEGHYLDACDIDVSRYHVEPDLLALEGAKGVRESLVSDLFSTLCPVTGQPDYATVIIEYEGPAISRAALLRYLISYRQDACFHEQAVERIFLDIYSRCSPKTLSVLGKFCRRGGIDIHPLRSSHSR